MRFCSRNFGIVAEMDFCKGLYKNTFMSYGLGRGLNSLIPAKKIVQVFSKDDISQRGDRLLDIPIENIKPNPKQPRLDFSQDELEELMQSIREHGILQPLVVSKIDDENYELIAGERRFRSAKFLNLKTVPAIVRTVNEQEKLELALIENIQRENLNSIEEARAFRQLMDEFNLTQEDVAKRVGKSRPAVANTVRLLNLPEEIQQAVREGKIKESHARTLLSFENQADQLKYFRQILKNDMTVRETENIVKKAHGKKISGADPNLTAKEETLRGVLGTKVEIKKTGRGGQVIIHFYSEEELGGIIKKISRNN